MKYLKEYNIQSDYTKEEISIYQLNKMVDDNYDFFTKKEYLDIINLFKVKFKFPHRIKSSIKFSVKNMKGYLLIVEFTALEENIRIFKLEDEWFWVDISGVGIFKCDQFDSLLQCLEDHFKNIYDFYYRDATKSWRS